MSFSAVFYFDGGPTEGQEIIRFSHGFFQARDNKGCPTTDVRSSMAGIKLMMTDNSELAKWMLNPFERRNARIVFKRSEQNSTFFEVKFEEAYCMFYQEKMNARGGKNASAVVDIYLSPKKIINRGASFNANWEV